MKKEKEILIIGGGPAGIVCASTAKKYYPDKKITLIKEKEKGVIPCGIPYMIFSLKDPQENILSTKGLEDMGVEVIVDKV
ncbi:MAG: pyridine nucleotide-disulfide oxidoreductase, partial [Candidatus Omnitrophota bacterium]